MARMAHAKSESVYIWHVPNVDLYESREKHINILESLIFFVSGKEKVLFLALVLLPLGITRGLACHFVQGVRP